MAVITISRQLGSLGTEIAKIVAEELGYHFVQRELINAAARRSGSQEAALATIDELGLLKLSPTPEACLAYRQAVQQVIEELAAAGNVVIVGRAGQAILAGRAGVLHVRLIAPAAIRAERVSSRTGATLAGALAQIRASDAHRARYLKRCYQVRWDDPALYDLVINTGRLTSRAAAEIILQAIQHAPSTQLSPNSQEPSVGPFHQAS